MISRIYINLLVEDLDKSVDFFCKLGFEFQPRFTKATTACMVVSSAIYVMLLTRESSPEYADQPFPGKLGKDAIFTLECGDSQEVDRIFDKAIAAGGTESRESMKLEYLYSRSFRDLDGHHWELLWIDDESETA